MLRVKKKRVIKVNRDEQTHSVMERRQIDRGSYLPTYIDALKLDILPTAQARDMALFLSKLKQFFLGGVTPHMQESKIDLH